MTRPGQSRRGGGHRSTLGGWIVLIAIFAVGVVCGLTCAVLALL